MSGINGVLTKLLAGAFYRRHAIFLGLLLMVFLGLVRPPQLLFSGMVIRPLMGSSVAACILMGICLVWVVYASARMLYYLRLPKSEFLSVMGAVGYGQRWGLAMAQVGIAGFLGLGYLGLMAFHGLAMGMWTGLVAVGVLLGGWGGCAAVLARAMGAAKRRGVYGGRPWLRMRAGLLLIFWKSLMKEHRSTLLIVKGFSLLFVGLMVVEGPGEVLPQLMALAFAISGLLQGFLPFRLRQTEETRLTWFKSLPIAWWRRVGTFFVLHLVVQLPELAWLGLGCWATGVAWWPVLEYGMAVMGLQLLALGMSYLPQMTSQDFLRLLFGMFIVLFLAIIFKVPLGMVYGGLALAGLGGCYWGMWRGDGSLEHFT